MQIYAGDDNAVVGNNSLLGRELVKMDINCLLTWIGCINAMMVLLRRSTYLSLYRIQFYRCEYTQASALHHPIPPPRLSTVQPRLHTRLKILLTADYKAMPWLWADIKNYFRFYRCDCEEVGKILEVIFDFCFPLSAVVEGLILDLSLSSAISVFWCSLSVLDRKRIGRLCGHKR